MCGRYVLKPDSNFSARFDLELEIDLEPNYNVAPGSIMPVVVKVEDKNQIVFMRWGFVPSWAKKLSSPREIINARAETLAEKNSFKQALQYTRCLVPASGFYEWKRNDGSKTPYYFYLKNQSVFSFAGLFNGETYTIITTSANKDVQSIHDRMPVVLTKSTETKWLTNNTKSSQDLKLLLNQSVLPKLAYHPVGNEVNKVNINNAKLIKPI